MGLVYIRGPNFSVGASQGGFSSAFQQVWLLARMFPWLGGAGCQPQLTGIVPQSWQGQTLAEDGEGDVDGQDWDGHRGAPAAEASAKNS